MKNLQSPLRKSVQLENLPSMNTPEHNDVAVFAKRLNQTSWRRSGPCSTKTIHQSSCGLKLQRTPYILRTEPGHVLYLRWYHSLRSPNRSQAWVTSTTSAIFSLGIVRFEFTTLVRRTFKNWTLEGLWHCSQGWTPPLLVIEKGHWKEVLNSILKIKLITKSYR